MKKNKKNIITKKKIKHLISEIKIIQRRMIDLINKDELTITEFLEVKELMLSALWRHGRIILHLLELLW